MEFGIADADVFSLINVRGGVDDMNGGGEDFG